MTTVEALLAAIVVTGIFAAVEIHRIRKDLSIAIQVFLGAWDSRWNNTGDQRQALLDLATAVESIDDNIGRIEAEICIAQADN